MHFGDGVVCRWVLAKVVLSSGVLGRWSITWFASWIPVDQAGELVCRNTSGTAGGCILPYTLCVIPDVLLLLWSGTALKNEI